MIDERLKNPGQLEGKHTYRIEWLNNIVSFYFDGKLMKTLGDFAEYNVDNFQIKYILLGRDNRYKVYHSDIKYYNLTIGEFIEDDGSIDPDSPDDTWDDQNNNQDSEEIIEPKKEEPLSFKETWEILTGEGKWIGIILLTLFLISIFFC